MNLRALAAVPDRQFDMAFANGGRPSRIGGVRNYPNYRDADRWLKISIDKKLSTG